MGVVCDAIGPRFGMSVTLLVTSPCVFGMALAAKPLHFILLRFGIGFVLAAFVTCQFWTSCMFNVKIVGIANATAAGWGNLGGGVTQLIMPMIFEGISKQREPFEAWRWAMFMPGFLHVLSGMFMLCLSTDLPDGNYAHLKRAGSMSRDSGLKMLWNATSNYRTWLLTVVYGFCFGIELTINNIIVAYLFDQFGVSLTVAGILGSLFGLTNIFARSIGGLGSDMAGKRHGMRGRLWTLYVLQSIQGVCCIVMGLAKGSLAGTIVLMVLFSLFVQSSEGATFGVVPFVSKRSLGVVSGLVGAGGNAGAVITQELFFKDKSFDTNTGVIYMGVMILCVTQLVIPIHFPMWGSMLSWPREGFVEEDYYLSEFTEEERAQGLADSAMKFAHESKSQRGGNFKANAASDRQVVGANEVEL